jgi:hypothetical protein
VSNWIDSGGNAPLLHNDDDWGNSDRRHARRLKAPLTIGITVLLLALCSHLGHAHDPSHPELNSWFDHLASGKGLCCSFADGTAVSDVDWKTRNGKYQVRIDGEWIDVPDEAVITEPNRVGRTMVWPLRGYLGTTVRCFMPGSMS